MEADICKGKMNVLRKHYFLEIFWETRWFVEEFLFPSWKNSVCGIPRFFFLPNFLLPSSPFPPTSFILIPLFPLASSYGSYVIFVMFFSFSLYHRARGSTAALAQRDAKCRSPTRTPFASDTHQRSCCWYFVPRKTNHSKKTIGSFPFSREDVVQKKLFSRKKFRKKFLWNFSLPVVDKEAAIRVTCFPKELLRR